MGYPFLIAYLQFIYHIYPHYLRGQTEKFTFVFLLFLPDLTAGDLHPGLQMSRSSPAHWTLPGTIRHHGQSVIVHRAQCINRLAGMFCSDARAEQSQHTICWYHLNIQGLLSVTDRCMAISCGRYRKLQYCNSAVLRHADCSRLIGWPAWITWPSLLSSDLYPNIVARASSLFSVYITIKQQL